MFCDAQSVGLVRYPATLAPNSGSHTVTAQCTDNASPTSSLSVMCQSDGTWPSSNTPKCLCNTGYKAVSDNGREFCQGLLDTCNSYCTCSFACIIMVFPSALTLIFLLFPSAQTVDIVTRHLLKVRQHCCADIHDTT